MLFQSTEINRVLAKGKVYLFASTNIFGVTIAISTLLL